MVSRLAALSTSGKISPKGNSSSASSSASSSSSSSSSCSSGAAGHVKRKDANCNELPSEKQQNQQALTSSSSSSSSDKDVAAVQHDNNTHKRKKSSSTPVDAIPVTASPEEKAEIAMMYAYLAKYAKSSWVYSICNLFYSVGLIVGWVYFCLQVRWGLLDSLAAAHFPTLVPHIWMANWAVRILAPFGWAGVAVRLFMIFHDCGHESYTPSPTVNAIIGTFLGAWFVETPYKYWKRGHAYHHQNSNNLDYHQASQTAPWTTEQWRKESRIVRALYNFYTLPYVMFFLTPVLFFFVYHPYVNFQSLRKPRRKAMHEGLMFFIPQILIPIYAPWAFLEIWFIGRYISMIMGLFLFHTQHTFEGAQRYRSDEWSYYRNGIYGSSFFQVPEHLKWITYGIEYHFAHHLNARIPSYRLRACYEEAPPPVAAVFARVPRITFWQGVQALKYQVYDENNKSLMTLADVMMN